MPKIPQVILDQQPPLDGLNLRGRGKVRDSYDLPGHPDNMLVGTSDRISIFDFVLPTTIPSKGEVLNALSFFWTNKVLEPICNTDFVAAGISIDRFLPENLRGDPELHKRYSVVRLLPEPNIESIVRLLMLGSGWESYKKNGTICGHRIPAGLRNGDRLPYPIFTPTTKEKEGHDVHVDADTVVGSHGFKLERLSLQVAGALASYAEERDIILGDTKFEFSGLVLADEKGTPDSSRFFDKTAWEKSVRSGKPASPLDKQYVREWGKKLGIDKLDPKKPEDVAFVHSQTVPDDVRKMTTLIYRYIFWRLTGWRLEEFQRRSMAINVEPKTRIVEVLIGSESDRPQIEAGIKALSESPSTRFRVSTMSCHRNPDELISFTANELVKADIIVAGAGKAADLPGMIKSYLCSFGRPDIPVIGVGFKGVTERDDFAAKSSIEDLPGQPVELDASGHAFFGSEGFLLACLCAMQDEFLPKPIEAKPTKIGDWNSLK